MHSLSLNVVVRNRMRFDLTDLRLFLNVHEAGTITGGAKCTCMTLASAKRGHRAPRRCGALRPLGQGQAHRLDGCMSSEELRPVRAPVGRAARSRMAPGAARVTQGCFAIPARSAVTTRDQCNLPITSTQSIKTSRPLPDLPAPRAPGGDEGDKRFFRWGLFLVMLITFIALCGSSPVPAKPKHRIAQFFTTQAGGRFASVSARFMGHFASAPLEAFVVQFDALLRTRVPSVMAFARIFSNCCCRATASQSTPSIGGAEPLAPSAGGRSAAAAVFCPRLPRTQKRTMPGAWSCWPPRRLLATVYFCHIKP
jgi:hypothetical protein